MYLPISVERPALQPVTPITDGASNFRDASQERPSTYVYRGELLDGNPVDRRYRPQPNQQVHPQNMRAINAYHRVANEHPMVGQILDGMI